MPARHLPPQPHRSGYSGAELAAYERVVAQQLSYKYDELLKMVPEEHRLAMQGMAGNPDDSGSLDDRIQPYMGAMLNSPLVMEHLSDLGAIYRSLGERDNSYSHSDREWADMVVAEELQAWGIYYSHMFDAVAVGVRIEAIRALREGRDEDLAPDELTKAKYIRQVVRQNVTSESYEKIESILGRRGAVEFTGFVAFLVMTVLLISAFGAHQGRTIEMVNELIQKISDGTVMLPSARARVTDIS